MVMIDVRHLRAFIAVAEELNFHRVAERLGTVQPALSRLIQSLEETARLRLLERTTRHVELTEAGKVFLIEARSLLNQLQGAVANARDVALGITGTLSLAYMDFAVHRILPGMLAAASAAEPGIKVDLTYMPTAQQRLALIEGRADLGIMIGRMGGLHVDSIVLSEEPLVAALPPGHRLLHKQFITIKDFAGEPLLLGSEHEWPVFREYVFALFAEKGASPRIVHEASSAAALFGLAASGLGVTLYSGIPRLYSGSGLKFRKIKGAPRLTIAAAWRKGPRLALVRRFLGAANLLK
jgi:LysR family transcriptional regulator, benzoate and cis,cis-muconate-responsive activator of ben and cat genes